MQILKENKITSFINYHMLPIRGIKTAVGGKSYLEKKIGNEVYGRVSLKSGNHIIYTILVGKNVANHNYIVKFV